MRFSKPQKCAVCKQLCFTPQDLTSHFEAFHSNRHFSTFSSSSAAAPSTFRHYPHQNRINPTLGFPVRNHFDRSGYLDDQGRFHKGFPPAREITPARKYHFLLPKMPTVPKLMDLFPATSSEDIRTLPLLCQMEQRRPENTVTQNGGANSSSIDLSLRL